MKKIEIIIPHERIDNANHILNKFGIRDEMSFYQINGREKLNLHLYLSEEVILCIHQNMEEEPKLKHLLKML